jgi:cephalosporin-C deacetylase-like acetyl esterase
MVGKTTTARTALIAAVIFAFSALPIARRAAAQQDAAPQVPKEYLTQFDYDASQALDSQVTQVSETKYYIKYHVSYATVNNERVTAFMYVPKSTIKDYANSLQGDDKMRFDKRVNTLDGPPWPAIFLMHWLQSDKSLADAFAPTLVQYGYVVFAIDGVFKGERAKPGRAILEYDPHATVANIRQQVIDTRRGADYLASRPDVVDINRLGYFGISMGSLTGVPATAVDTRFKAVVLADGAAGLNTIFKKAQLPEFKEIVKKIEEQGYTLDQAYEVLKVIDPIYFAPLISPRPALIINGKYDEIFPKEAMQALHNAVREPKKLVWYDSGHILPVNSVIIQMLNWFKLYLK